MDTPKTTELGQDLIQAVSEAVTKEYGKDCGDVTIIISKKFYKELLTSQGFLYHLYTRGVDNWEGYEDAVESYKNED